MLQLVGQVTEACHLFMMDAHDLAHLAAGEFVAPFAGFAGAEEYLGFIWLLLEDAFFFQLLQSVEGRVFDGQTELCFARVQCVCRASAQIALLFRSRAYQIPITFPHGT